MKLIYLVVQEVRQVWRGEIHRETAGPPGGPPAEAAQKPVRRGAHPVPLGAPGQCGELG